MRERRRGRTILAALMSFAILAPFIFLGNIFAQEDMPMDEGMPPEDMMGMPGMGAPAGGGALTWSEQPMPEDLTMTYDEFAARYGQPRAPIPETFLFDAEGNPELNTKNQWEQLQRIYASRGVGAAAAEEAVAGKPGYGLATRITREMTAKENELEAINYLYQKGLDNFTFTIRYPQVTHSAISPGMSTVPIEVGVIMKVKPGVDQRYPTLVYRKMKKFDHYGTDRQIFRIVDYEGGMWNPKEIYLWNGTVSAWNGLWPQNNIRLTLYDAAGGQIVSGTQSAGHTGGILANLVHPSELNYAPMHETIIPPQDKSFRGGNLNLPYTEGWYYNFTFNIPLAQLAGLDRAEATLIGAGGIEGSRGATSAPPPQLSATYEGDASRASVQAGTERATDAARRGVGMSGYSLGPPVYTGPVM